jgi:hypothetical protein
MVAGAYSPPPPAAAPQPPAVSASGGKYLDRSLNKSVDRSIASEDELREALGEDFDDPTKAPIRALVRALLAEAVTARATEVRVLQMPDRLTARYRIDGQWHERDRMPLKLKRPLFAMLREMADDRGVIPADAARTPVEWHLHEQPSLGCECMVLAPQAPGTPPASTLPPDDEDTLQSLLALQGADGWFEWSEHVVGTGDRRQRLESVIAEWLGGPPDLKVTATVAVLARLRSHHKPEHDLWRRAERKGLRWLAATVGRTEPDADTWLEKLVAESQPEVASAQ